MSFLGDPVVGPDARRLLSIMAVAAVAALAVCAPDVHSAPLGAHVITTIADSGPGTLRQAILDSNASPESDLITFALSGCSPVCVIRPSIALPPLLGGNIVLDGFSQAGAQEPSAGSPALLKVAIDGSDVDNQNGLNIASGSNVVRGLAIYGFGGNGIAIGGPDATSNRVWGNHIGLDAAGQGLASRRPNGLDGVFMGLGARSNLIGGDLLTERNVISGNGWDGVGVHGADTLNNQIRGNLIGLDATGAVAVPNDLDGVRLYGGAGPLQVGVADDLGQRNVISGNGRDGIRMAGEGTQALHADGNLIGTSWTGFAALGNAGDGVHALDGARTIVLGSASTPALGLISGNGGHGVHFENVAGATIFRHFIGVDGSGTVALPNEDGIRVVDTPGVSIGGNETGLGNLISGNRGAGIVFSGSATTNCTVEGNRIGVNVSATAALGNGQGGVRILAGANDNGVGGPLERGNLIAGNTGSAVEIDGAGTDANKVRGNFLGTNPDIATGLGNSDAGVHVHGGAVDTQIGGMREGDGNVIAGNAVGISLQNASGSLVFFNWIGAESESADRLGNATAGLRIEDGSTGTYSQGNEIAFNGEEGVLILGAPTQGNRLLNERIHDNGGRGIRLGSGAHGGIAPPVLISYSLPSRTVTGNGCPGCGVEVFSDAADEGAEPLAVGSVNAGGAFSLVLPAAPSHAFLTAIVTDATFGSSAFAEPLPAVASTPTPTETATHSATPTPTATDTLTPSPTATATPTISPTTTPTGSPTTTPTGSPTTTSTPTATVTGAATATASPAATVTATDTPSATATTTAAASATATATGSGPATATPSPTPTLAPATGTPTSSATVPPGATATRTPPTNAPPESWRIWLPYLLR